MGFCRKFTTSEFRSFSTKSADSGPSLRVRRARGEAVEADVQIRLPSPNLNPPFAAPVPNWEDADIVCFRCKCEKTNPWTNSSTPRAGSVNSPQMHDLNLRREQADVHLALELKNAATDLTAAVSPERT